MTAQTNDSKFATAEWIVSANISDGATHTTIAAALTTAVSGDTIFIRPGTYTENLTLKAGVNLVAYTGDGFTPTVTIIGTLSASYSGTASVSGMRLQTNGANIISLTGANVTDLFITDCYLNATNATAISSTGSNSAAAVRLTNCKGDIGTTGITYFNVTNGNLAILQNFIGASGLTTTASVFSGLQCTIFGCDLSFPISTSGTTASTRIEATAFDLKAAATAVTADSTSSAGTRLFDCFVNSMTSTPISIGAAASCTLSNVALNHSNAVAIAGTGTLIYSNFGQPNTAGTIAPTVTSGRENIRDLSLESATNYTLLAGPTAAGGILQSLASVGTAGQTLVSNGAGALPTFQSVSNFTGPSQQNFGISYSAGTFTLHSANGTALSATNPGVIVLESRSTPGLFVRYIVTANQSWIDDAGASEIINNTFGTTTGIAWASAMPFYIYAVGNDAQDTIQFMLARVPNRRVSPAVTEIGAPDDAVANTQGSFWSFDNIDETLYDTNPCLNIGSFRMVKSTADDWTVQTLATGSDGVGQFNEYAFFAYPQAQNGAATSSHLKANGGTAPLFSTNTYLYSIETSGYLNIFFNLSGDAGTDGAGAVNTLMTLPIICDTAVSSVYLGDGLVSNTTFTNNCLNFFDGTDIQFIREGGGGNVTNANFGNGARIIRGFARGPISKV